MPSPSPKSHSFLARVEATRSATVPVIDVRDRVWSALQAETRRVTSVRPETWADLIAAWAGWRPLRFAWAALAVALIATTVTTWADCTDLADEPLIATMEEEM